MAIEKMWKLKELRQAWQTSELTLRRAIHDGSLKAVRIGKRGLRVPDSEVQRYLQERGIDGGGR